jgi:hypothetical protein
VFVADRDQFFTELLSAFLKEIIRKTMQEWLFFSFFDLCAVKDLINLLWNFNKQFNLALFVFPLVNEKVGTHCQYLLELADLKVALH